MIRRSAFVICFDDAVLRAAMPVWVYVVAVILRKTVDEYTAVPANNCLIQIQDYLSTATHYRSTWHKLARLAGPALHRFLVLFGFAPAFIASPLDSVGS